MRSFRALPFVILALPGFVQAATPPTTFQGLAQVIVGFLNTATVLLIFGAVAVYFFGVVRAVFNSSEGSSKENRSLLLWGIIVIFLMVSLWGILQILENTLFGGTPSGLQALVPGLVRTV